MTDAEHADRLRRLNRLLGVGLDLEDWAAIERAIELLEWEAEKVKGDDWMNPPGMVPWLGDR